MEHSGSVLEYFDQTQPIKLVYASPKGRRMGVWHTPDFFVIRDREAGWEEWKTEEELQRLKSRNPSRYFPNAQGRWSSSPGTAYAEPLGLYYRVRSSAEIDWTFQRNIQFLDDYLRVDLSIDGATGQEKVRAYVSAVPWHHSRQTLAVHQGEYLSGRDLRHDCGEYPVRESPRCSPCRTLPG